MADPTPLSPAAQAVLDAATSVKHPEIETVAFQCSRLEIAAALRAVANQLTPYSVAELDGAAMARNRIITIAAELQTPDP